MLVLAAAVAPAQEPGPAEAGFVRLADARAEGGVYRWEDGVFAGERCLVWPGGTLTLPETVTPEDFGAADLLIPFGDRLRGVGPDGELLFEDGRYEIDQPLLLRDGRITLYLAEGVIEIRSGRIDYSWTPKSTDQQGGYLVLVGVVMAIAILFFRARRYGKT